MGPEQIITCNHSILNEQFSEFFFFVILTLLFLNRSLDLWNLNSINNRHFRRIPLIRRSKNSINYLVCFDNLMKSLFIIEFLIALLQTGQEHKQKMLIILKSFKIEWQKKKIPFSNRKCCSFYRNTWKTKNKNNFKPQQNTKNKKLFLQNIWFCMDIQRLLLYM